MIVEVLVPFWMFFVAFLIVFGRFLGFGNIAGGAQSVVNGIRKYRRRSPKRSKWDSKKRGTLRAPTRGHPYFGSLLEPQGFP